jgi:hypothetical protein
MEVRGTGKGGKLGDLKMDNMYGSSTEISEAWGEHAVRNDDHVMQTPPPHTHNLNKTPHTHTTTWTASACIKGENYCSAARLSSDYADGPVTGPCKPLNSTGSLFYITTISSWIVYHRLPTHVAEKTVKFPQATPWKHKGAMEEYCHALTSALDRCK